MRLVLLFAVLALIAVALETAVPYWFWLRVLLPNLIVILAVDLGFRHHGVIPAILAFAMGYATDSLSGTSHGLNALLITVVYLFAYELSTRLLLMTGLVGMVTVFISVMFTQLGAIALSSGVSALGMAGPQVPHLAASAGVSAILAPAVFALLDRSKRMVGLRVSSTRE